MNKDTIGMIVLRLVIAILFLITYLYIEKLEQIGCECAEHPNKNFVKNFSLFGVVYSIVGIIMSFTGSVNKTLSLILAGIETVFLFVVGFYFYFTIDYIRYLINEKCKCSEDLRRELIMWGSIIELLCIVVVFLVAMVIPVVSNATFTAVESIPETKKGISKALNDPVGSLVDIKVHTTKGIKDIAKSTKKIMKSANSGILNRRS